MIRNRRSSSQENQTWGNPCDLDASVVPSTVTYTPKHAEVVKGQALHAFNNADNYKDELALKFLDINFTAVRNNWKSVPWMHHWSLSLEPWYHKDTMPSEKKYGKDVSEEYLDQLMTKIDYVLPSMYKCLKIVVASLYAINAQLSQHEDDFNQHPLKAKLVNTSFDVRSVLCEFEALMRARDLKIMPLLDSEIKDYPTDTNNRLQNVLLVYRDTLNYLEYIKQVFEKMATTPVGSMAVST